MLLQRVKSSKDQLANFLRNRGPVHGFLTSFYSSADGWNSMGSVQENEFPFLREMCEEAAAYPGPIVEIGTLFGFTTTKLALWKRADQELLTVDNYSWNPCGLPPAAHQELTRRVLEYVVSRAAVKQLNEDKQAFFDGYRGPPPAMVFLDADHAYEPTKADIAWAKSVGAKIICGHDYKPEHPGVVRAVEEAGGAVKRVGSVWRLPG